MKLDVKYELSIVLKNFGSNKTWCDWFPSMERRFSSVHGLSFFVSKPETNTRVFFVAWFFGGAIFYANVKTVCLNFDSETDYIITCQKKLQLKLKCQTCDFPKCLTKSCWILLLVILHIKKFRFLPSDYRN